MDGCRIILGLRKNHKNQTGRSPEGCDHVYKSYSHYLAQLVDVLAEA